MKKYNNKGAALVSVMIAITFISIVSTTLLVISLNNYQMKVVNSQSKSNFYETEQRVNIVTANVRNSIMGSTDVAGDIGVLLNGTEGQDYSGASYPYLADKIADLAFPGETVRTNSDGYRYVGFWVDPSKTGLENEDHESFIFYPGTVKVTSQTNGKTITVDNLTIKQISSDKDGGYENTIKTDVNFYVQIASTGGNGGGGVGSCAFLLDSTVRMKADDKSCRLSITGNTIMGDYTYHSSGSYLSNFDGTNELSTPVSISPYSEPASIDKSKTGANVTGITKTTSNYEKAIIYLDKCSFMNFNSQNNVIIGDIVLTDKSLLYVLDGNFTVYGDIFVLDNAAFICEGTLNLGYNSGIYRVTSSSIEKITASNKNKNIIFKTKNELDKVNYDKLAYHLNLLDNDGDNDGILPKILQPSSTTSKYCYDTSNAFQTTTGTLCTFDGIAYKASYPAANLNADHANELVFITDNLEGSGICYIVKSVPNSTIIGRKPVVAYDTKNITVSKMGDRAFNYILKNDSCKITVDGSTVSINEYFKPNCNSYVMTVFNISSGGDSDSTPTPTKTAISYSDWIKK